MANQDLQYGWANIRSEIDAELRRRSITDATVSDDSKIVDRMRSISVWIDVREKRVAQESFDRKEIDDSHTAIDHQAAVKVRALVSAIPRER